MRFLRQVFAVALGFGLAGCPAFLSDDFGVRADLDASPSADAEGRAGQTTVMSDGGLIADTEGQDGRTTVVADGGLIADSEMESDTADDAPDIDDAPDVDSGMSDGTAQCASGTTECVSDTQEKVCGPDGQWSQGNACKYVCISGACGGVCVPGTSTCSTSGPTVQVCDANGQWGPSTKCQVTCGNVQYPGSACCSSAGTCGCIPFGMSICN